MHRCLLPILTLFLLVGVTNRAAAEESAGQRPEPAFPAASPALIQGLQELLDEGFNVGPRTIQTSRKKFESLRRLATRDDPRVEFAYGLVLLRHSQTKPAAVQFETAAGRKGPVYWPAWQALIWSQLVEKQYDKGLARLDEFAALVGSPDDKGADITEPQRDAARWIGQVLESLDRTVAGQKFHDQLVEHDARIRESLGEELSELLDMGREIIHERDLELAHEAGRTQEEAERKLARRREGQKGKLESDLVDIDKEKENAAKSADDWKLWLDERLGKIDKQLGQLEKDYQYQQKRAESLQQSIFLVGREITALDLQLSTYNPRQSGQGFAASVIYGQAQQQLLVRQNQLVNYQVEYNATIGRMNEFARQGQAALEERAAIVQKYEKATGDLVKKTADLDKWAARVAEKKKKLEVQTTGKTKGILATAAQKTPSLKSYVPFDVDAEKARLLATFGIEPATRKDPADAPAK